MITINIIGIIVKELISFKKKSFYITTAIAYLNGKPHMGHALEIIQADCLARFYRLFGESLVFQTGADEHGLKILNTAQEKGMDVKDLLNENYQAFLDFYRTLNISFDKYVRTTSEIHKKGASKLWKTLADKGDIYKGTYNGLYCIGCEAYKSFNELVENKCPNHPNREIITLREENYFFKLSKYIERLIKIYEKDEIQIIPKRRKSEIVNILKDGLDDISFSRQKEKMPWGIPVPNDKDHVMYVWADALSNYITNVGYEFSSKEFNLIWPANIHLIGKDIVKFHAIYWPAILLSAGLQLPNKLFIHGFLTVEGLKIGKSIGNVSDPLILLEKYGVPTFRFYLLKNISTYDDGSFSENDLIQIYNNVLGNDLGNLVLRVLTFIEKDFELKYPSLYSLSDVDKKYVKEFYFVDEIKIFFDSFQINKALDRVWEFVKLTNKFINDRKPWELKKNNNIEEYSTTLYVLLEGLRIIAIYLKPFIPSISKKMMELIGNDKDYNFNDLDFNPNIIGQINKKEVLFPKLEIIMESEQEKETEDYITYDEFKRLDIRIGSIEDIEKVENADKLYKLTVDIGTEKRIIVAGLAEYYEIKELKGKKITLLINLKPRKIRGILSQGMLLAADDGKLVSILTPDKDVNIGSKIQ
ncbi:MAG: methionine--tRNA ligase [Candidatus Lokiarchaeota archaeon]|nr:methionine--tRNA ligase [Candidatus Lokiarchaeota archaeon]